MKGFVIFFLIIEIVSLLYHADSACKNDTSHDYDYICRILEWFLRVPAMLKRYEMWYILVIYALCMIYNMYRFIARNDNVWVLRIPNRGAFSEG